MLHLLTLARTKPIDEIIQGIFLSMPSLFREFVFAHSVLFEKQPKVAENLVSLQSAEFPKFWENENEGKEEAA